MEAKTTGRHEALLITRCVGRQLRDAQRAPIQQELPPELQRVMERLLDPAGERLPRMTATTGIVSR